MWMAWTQILKACVSGKGVEIYADEKGDFAGQQQN